MPEDVADRYLSLAVDGLITDVLRHYRGMWPGIKSPITKHASNRATDPLILEGSALWPGSVAMLHLDNVSASWLTASHDLLEACIRSSSRFDDASRGERELIKKFMARTVCYDELMIQAVQRLGLISIEVEPEESTDDLMFRCLERLFE